MTITAQQIWETSLGQLQLQVARSSYDTWLKGTTGLALEDDWLTVAVPTPFAAEWLEHRMYQLIQRAVTEVAACPLQVRFQVSSRHQTTHRAVALESESIEAQRQPQDSGMRRSPNHGTAANGTFNHRYTFQSFVIGTSNQLAFAAANAVAQHPGEQYNPLFIYSSVGQGKTHLLHAIASAVAQRDLLPLYVTAEQFTNDFIQAIRERKTEDFRQKYRSADVLLLDDIQFLAGKEQTQEGFFHTFNELHNTNRQIVITCDRLPRAVSFLEDRLLSRFEWGLIADIQPPDLETRLAILHNKAHAMGTTINDAVATLIAHRAYRSVRELEGCLNRVVALAQFTDKAITDELATIALADIAPAVSKTTISPSDAIAQIAAYYHLSPEDLCERRRDRKTTHEQRIAMYILNQTLHQSPEVIAQLLGNWHKKTIHNVLKQINQQLTNDPTLAKEVHTLTSSFASPDH